MEHTLDYQEWKKRRNRDSLFSHILIFVVGLETSAVSIAMLYYLQDRLSLNLEKARMYFSIAEMFNSIGQISGGILIGRYVDRTRNLRFVILVTMWPVIVGNILYSLPVNIGFIVFGRVLCGMSESLQVAFGGEFRRCYTDVELIQVIGWNEISYSIGYTIGPGAPVLLSWIQLNIGPWKLDKYNAINVFIAAFTLFGFIILWFNLSNSSKELDQLKAKYLKTKNEITNEILGTHSQHDELTASTQSRQTNTRNAANQIQKQTHERVGESSDTQSDTKEARKVQKQTQEAFGEGSDIQSETKEKSETCKGMKWGELIQIDIVTICLSYGIIRYSCNTIVALIAMYAVSIFHWQVDSLSWLNVFSSSGFYLVMAILVRFRAFQGKSFLCYATALDLTLFSLANLLLPFYIHIQSYAAQMTYLVCHMFSKAWMFFHAQSAGKILLFNTVTTENSGFINGVRSTVGSLMRLLAFGTSFLCFEHPLYFLLPMGVVQFIMSCIIFMRFDKHTRVAGRK